MLVCDYGRADQLRQPGRPRLRLLAGDPRGPGCWPTWCTRRTGWAGCARSARRRRWPAPGQTQIRYPCRVRAADGTWRYVEATISRHRSQGAPDRLLVTARDVSDQVALRRQVAHLTYHDGLTGLPNRAYLEDRARDALSLATGATASRAAAPARMAGVILVDLDAFTGVNDVVRAQRGRPGAGPGGAQAARGRAAAGHGGPLGRRRVRGPDHRAPPAPRKSSSWPNASWPAWPPSRSGPLTGLSRCPPASAWRWPTAARPAYVWRNADAAVSRAKEAGGGRLEVYAGAAARRHAPPPELAAELSLARRLSGRSADGPAGAGLPAHRRPGQLAGHWRGRRCRVAARRDATVPRAEFLDVGRDLPGDRRAGRLDAARVLRPGGGLVAERLGGQRLGALLTSGRWAAGSPSPCWPRWPPAGSPRQALILEVGWPDAGRSGGAPSARARRAARARRPAGHGCLQRRRTPPLARLRQLPVDVIRIGPALVAGLGVRTPRPRPLIRAHGPGWQGPGHRGGGGRDRAGRAARPAPAMGCVFGLGAFLAGPAATGQAVHAAWPGGSRQREPGRQGAPVRRRTRISPAETNVLSS